MCIFRKHFIEYWNIILNYKSINILWLDIVIDFNSQLNNQITSNLNNYIYINKNKK